VSEYFCSYMVFRGSIVSGYGDLIFNSKVTDGNELLVNIKDHIIKSEFSEFENINIVITSLNKL
jgi:hypothetical protein